MKKLLKRLKEFWSSDWVARCPNCKEMLIWNKYLTIGHCARCNHFEFDL